jgi:uncharacterized radical SAM protein YgiQ
MDSMINHYTANKKGPQRRRVFAGRADRQATGSCDAGLLPACTRGLQGRAGDCGGVEASLRRLAHYDYWSDKVRRSILLDCKADLLALRHGRRCDPRNRAAPGGGASVRDLRDMRGVAYALGASESHRPMRLVLPSYEQVCADKLAFAEATRLIHNETNPYNARRLVQFHDRQAVVVNPPRLPISQAAMDRIYDCPIRGDRTRLSRADPGFEMIRDSVTIMRGCFGGCTFCSITAHQGRIIQSRSPESVLEPKSGRWPRIRNSKRVVSDIGGPTANMYEMQCTRPEVEASVGGNRVCIRPSANCWAPTTDRWCS